MVMHSHATYIIGIGILELEWESVQLIQKHLRLPSSPFILCYY